MPTLHLLIKGKVQGVFYRATAKEVADKLGITGWIKNTPAGDVEAIVSGNEGQLHEFVSWCKEGPKKAEVTEVSATEQKELSFEHFLINR